MPLGTWNTPELLGPSLFCLYSITNFLYLFLLVTHVDCYDNRHGRPMGICHEISLGWKANEERQRLESFRKHPLHRHVPLIREHSTEMYCCRLPLPDYARR